jgi:hypothetical protein
MITRVQLLLLVLHAIIPDFLMYYSDEITFSLECVFICFLCTDIFSSLLNVVRILRFCVERQYLTCFDNNCQENREI